MRIPETVQRTLDALKKNNMVTHFVEHATDVVPLLETLLQEGDIIGLGGSMTLEDCNVLPFLRSGRYRLLDRYAPGLSPEDITALHRACFSANVYLTSTNALTEDGALVNVDGNSNRVAAMAYGPDSVIVVTGVNKIVPNEQAAYARIEAIAAPRNAKRLARKTPCTITGTCEHCQSSDRICCSYVVQRWQRTAKRIHVIIVNETLGY